MTPLPVVSGRECVTALQRVGFRVVRQRGSHVVLKNDETGHWTSVPQHRELDRGTLRSILRQAGVTVDAFTDLL